MEKVCGIGNDWIFNCAINDNWCKITFLCLLGKKNILSVNSHCSSSTQLITEMWTSEGDQYVQCFLTQEKLSSIILCSCSLSQALHVLSFLVEVQILIKCDDDFCFNHSFRWQRFKSRSVAEWNNILLPHFQFCNKLFLITFLLGNCWYYSPLDP